MCQLNVVVGVLVYVFCCSGAVFVLHVCWGGGGGFVLCYRFFAMFFLILYLIFMVCLLLIV